MPAESDLYSALSGDTDVTDIVGTSIFSDLPDEGVDAPFVFFERLDTEMVYSIHTPIPIAQYAQLAVICYADTREIAEDLGDKCVIAAANANLIYTGRQGEYDPDSKLFAAAIELRHNS